MALAEKVGAFSDWCGTLSRIEGNAETVAVTDAATALAAATRTEPDIVVFSLTVREHAVALARELRARAKPGVVRVVALARVLEALPGPAFDAYLQAPITVDVLCQTLGLERRRRAAS